MWIAIGQGLIKLEKFAKKPKFNIGEDVRIDPNISRDRELVYKVTNLSYATCFVVANIYEKTCRSTGKHYYRYGIIPKNLPDDNQPRSRFIIDVNEQTLTRF